jgi:phage tail sheath protein FI
MHGIKVLEVTDGTRPIRAISTSIIGLVATAGAVAGPLTAALDAAFPLDTPVLVTDIRSAIRDAGTTGTLKAALEAIADQASPVVVVVRVGVATGDAEDPTQDDLVIGDSVGGSYSGMKALLAAQGRLGVRPRIIGAPGLDTEEVATELAIIARQLRGMAYAMAIGDDVAEAVLYRGGFSARELMLLWPGFVAGGLDTVARAMGLRARIDNEIGWFKTLSNIGVDGVTGLAKDIFFDINTETNDAALLNAADITTMIRQDGYRFWGNRTTSDEPLFAFESATRTAQVIQDEIAAGLLWAIDKPLNARLIRDITETVNARLRTLVSAGALIGARCWYDPALNPAADLAAGKLVIDYDFTPVAPLESLTLNQRITDRYYANFADGVA